MRGLGGINGTPGSFTTLFDKVGVNGAGDLSPTSIVVLNGRATANFATNDSFQVNTTIRVVNASIPALNGDTVVDRTGDNWCSWPTAAANGTSTSVTTIKIAPLGFSTLFTATNRRSYKSTSLDAGEFVISINDTTARYLTIALYETMTSITAGTNKTHSSDVAEWPKSDVASAAMKDWFIIGDDRGFYFGVSISGTPASGDIAAQSAPFTIYWVGEEIDETPIKKYCASLYAENGTAAVHVGRHGDGVFGGINITNTSIYGNYPGYYSHSMARDFSGVSKSIRVLIGTDGGSYNSGNFSDGPPFPNPGNNKIFVTQLVVREELSFCRRAKKPGAYALAHRTSGTLATGAILEDVVGLENRKLMAFTISGVSYTQILGVMLFDITGGWRT